MEEKWQVSEKVGKTKLGEWWRWLRGVTGEFFMGEANDKQADEQDG